MTGTGDTAGRIVVALGGNAIAAPGRTDPEAQREAVEGAAAQIAELVADGFEVVVTHGNGPQVGNLLVKNEMARNVVPPVPLDWCVAQTQATLGFLLVTALEAELAHHAVPRPVVAVVTRVLVDADDPGWARPTKPIGRFLAPAGARRRVARGERWQDCGERGWRRVVASPLPREVLEGAVVARLADEGVVVVAAGGGGIPMVAAGGTLRGREAVLDKDWTASQLAERIGADLLVIATDVPGVAVHYGTARERWLERTTVAQLRALDAEGHFAGGSMAPKVEAAIRFVEHGGGRAAIGPLDRVLQVSRGTAGTVVEPVPAPT